MTRFDEVETGRDAARGSRSARQMPFALRLLVAAIFAAIVAFGASYTLRVLNL